jgi:hypothetical protein
MPFHAGDAMHEVGAEVTVGLPARSVLWLAA